MTNSAMSLSTATLGGSKPVSLGYIGPNETMNYSHMERMWIIEQNGASYTLKNGDNSQGGYLTAVNSAAETQVYTMLGVINNGKWNLVPYTGPVLQGAFLTDPSPEVVVGTAFNLDAVVYSTAIGVNGPATFSAVGLDNNPATTVMLDPNTGSGSVGVPGVVFIELAFTGSDVKYKYPLSIKTNTCKTVVLDMKYDHAYLLRYPDAVDRIRSHFYALRDLYIYEFDIWVVMTGPTLFSCYACINCSSTSVERCTHVADTECYNSNKRTGIEQLYEHHHTNIYNIAYRVPRPDKTMNLNAYFLGHDCCMEGMYGGVLHLPAPNGIGSKEFGVIIINEFGSLIKERMTVIHEFGHLYEAPDHYDFNNIYPNIPSSQELRADTGDNRFNERCMYGESNNTTVIQEGLVICEGCKARILDNRDNYNHMS